MFIIVFVSQNITFNNNEIIKFEIKFKILNVLIFDVTTATIVTAITKIEMIFLNYDVLCSRTKRRVVNSTTFFLNQKNFDVIEFHQLFQFEISRNFYELIDIVRNKNDFDKKIDQMNV